MTFSTMMNRLHYVFRPDFLSLQVPAIQVAGKDRKGLKESGAFTGKEDAGVSFALFADLSAP